MHAITSGGKSLPSIVILTIGFLLLSSKNSVGDGLVMPKRNYAGSLEERSQEAIIIFQPQDDPGEAVEDLILSIEVQGRAAEFAWIIPLPEDPQVFKEDPALFQELFDLIEHKRVSKKKLSGSQAAVGDKSEAEAKGVEVISRRVVGDYDLTTVREGSAGALNPWLDENGFKTLEGAEDVIRFYREKDCVFVCIRYTASALAEEGRINSHPLRFRFKTGGRDGMFFPMKLSGLQKTPFDVTLYVFCPSWINNDLNQFGFVNRGFRLAHRDWDTPQCIANAGKNYSAPQTDPYLKSFAGRMPAVTKLFQAQYPGHKFYLTKIQADQLDPESVRRWSDDLWLFPYYTNRSMVPYDARAGGPASIAWPNAINTTTAAAEQAATRRSPNTWIVLVVLALMLGAIGFRFWLRRPG